MPFKALHMLWNSLCLHVYTPFVCLYPTCMFLLRDIVRQEYIPYVHLEENPSHCTTRLQGLNEAHSIDPAFNHIIDVSLLDLTFEILPNLPILITDKEFIQLNIQCLSFNFQ